MWDGKVRLYSMFTQELYVGLKSYLEHFCKERDYTIDYSQYVEQADSVTYDIVKEFCLSLKLASKGEPIEVRDYQIDAVYQAISDGRRLLLSPTGSGKSLILYCLLRWNLKANRKQLILVPTTSLWQSLYKLPKQFFAMFDVIYGDEAHNFKAKSLTSILNKCTSTPFRVGTTGTLDGTKTHKLVLEGLFGPVYKVTTTKKLIDNKQLADLKIYNIILEYADEIRKSCKGFDYQKEMDFIVGNLQRNKFIRNLSLKQEGNTLVLFQYVEKHGKVLYEMIKEKAGDRKIFFVSGETDVTVRESVRSITEEESNAIIVASYGTFSTGINIRNLHNIIFASPSKSRIRNLQSIGRGLRTSGTKTECKLYDIADDLSWKAKKNYTLLHMIERIKIYNDEHFNYKLVKVPI